MLILPVCERGAALPLWSNRALFRSLTTVLCLISLEDLPCLRMGPWLLPSLQWTSQWQLPVGMPGNQQKPESLEMDSDLSPSCRLSDLSRGGSLESRSSSSRSRSFTLVSGSVLYNFQMLWSVDLAPALPPLEESLTKPQWMSQNTFLWTGIFFFNHIKFCTWLWSDSVVTDYNSGHFSCGKDHAWSHWPPGPGAGKSPHRKKKKTAHF